MLPGGKLAEPMENGGEPYLGALAISALAINTSSGTHPGRSRIQELLRINPRSSAPPANPNPIGGLLLDEINALGREAVTDGAVEAVVEDADLGHLDFARRCVGEESVGLGDQPDREQVVGLEGQILKVRQWRAACLEGRMRRGPVHRQNP